ncbi:IDEAL domain-containing protein [Paludifilum halophilum]|uniref:IDEAL domain-containing protein n=1 Tax=Paludifilum halophilum TaxID=1642702 RepID=A0A235B3U6_9BACL|nr:IDEAL domain-containing protein [Paludifilum halophilum]OYD06980.1 hypothetical protein CHM34_13675 [Paludifilum halophilum]
MEALITQFNDGDWVTGKTFNDELFQGYIEAIDHERETAKIRVIQSDNPHIIGKLSLSLLENLRPYETTSLKEEGHLLNLIDLALTTKDKKWFMELTSSLKERKSQVDSDK